MTSTNLTITSVEIFPIDIELTDDFTIASGSMNVAKNLFIRMTLHNGAIGYGEVAPFTSVTGEDREMSEQKCRSLGEKLIGRSVEDYRSLSAMMKESEPHQPAARCGLETVILDALCRSEGVPMWKFFGGARTEGLLTDITIPIATEAKSIALARRWYERGFRTLKMKVGADANAEIAIIRRIDQTFSGVSFIVDANQGFGCVEAIEFIRQVKSAGCNIVLFEQPTRKDDLDGMRVIRERAGVLVAADESVKTIDDARRVIEAEAADVINLKIMKSGVLETLEIAALAHDAGLQLMIGGMVETRLAMSCSLAIAMGLGTIRFLDLDTPLLMKTDPLRGGYRYDGPRLIPWTEAGLGIAL